MITTPEPPPPPTTALDYLKDRTDERVKTALTRRCGICRAKPGSPCRHPFETREPLDRIVHLERTQQHLDKRKAS